MQLAFRARLPGVRSFSKNPSPADSTHPDGIDAAHARRWRILLKPRGWAIRLPAWEKNQAQGFGRVHPTAVETADGRETGPGPREEACAGCCKCPTMPACNPAQFDI